MARNKAMKTSDDELSVTGHYNEGATASIRDVREDDWSSILSIEQLRYGSDGYDVYFVRMIPKLFSKTCLVAEKYSDGLAGYALGSFEDETPTVAWILSVLAKTDGEGIGTQLTQACVERLESLGAQTILLTVAPDNARAISIYRKLGFTDQGFIKDYYGKGADRHVMQRIVGRT